MPMTLAQAAEATGRSRSTLLRTIRKGQISASRDAAGGFLVDESELSRVFPIRGHDAADARPLPSLAAALARLEAADARIADKDTTIADLRHRLDEERAERRQTTAQLSAAQERIAALLTHQGASAASPAAPRRRWWRWGRG